MTDVKKRKEKLTASHGPCHSGKKKAVIKKGWQGILNSIPKVRGGQARRKHRTLHESGG